MKKLTTILTVIIVLISILDSCQHEHNYVAKITKDPTCGSVGIKTYECSKCGDSFIEELPATGDHKYESKITKKETCASTGTNELTCKICGSKKSETIPATGKHNYKTSVVKAATCVSEGSKKTVCSVCGDSFVEAIPATGKHNYTKKVTSEATCTAEGTVEYVCGVCGDSYSEKTAATGKHNYIGTVTTAATCSKDGVKTFTCSMCNNSYTEKISSTGQHSYTSKVTKAATCTKDGVKTFTCSGCGKSYTETIKAGHKWVNATCTSPKHCSVCSKTEGVALGHKISSYKCSRCGIGFGQVKGQITYQYNKYVGTRGDNGAHIVLIPKNSNTKNYNNSLAAMFITGTYESGIIVTKCDGYGNFDFGDSVPEGNYIILVVSKCTTGSAYFNNKSGLEAAIADRFGKYFSSKDLETLTIFIGAQNYATGDITVEKARVNTITKDFGYTYI
ncbi:MAG: hypothetical protein II777_02825 [Clostridia bacterium]|nr:hypothetical protein [Clostridia bacterium]